MGSGHWSDRPHGRRLPPTWRTVIRPYVLARDPTCRLGYAHCTVTTTEVDHIDDPDDHSFDNLRGVCSSCHRTRTEAQARIAREAARAARPRRRPATPHPGVTTDNNLSVHPTPPPPRAPCQPDDEANDTGVVLACEVEVRKRA